MNMDNIEETIENRFQGRSQHSAEMILSTKGSAGNNPLKLAQICTIWDFVMKLMNWQDTPLADLTTFLTQYQGSVDAMYHRDFKDVLIAEEIERRREQRKGVSILQQ